ncbi:hypothetical protein M413DRAFT_446917, partial [Hebeloma cylindrosporum]
MIFVYLLAIFWSLPPIIMTSFLNILLRNRNSNRCIVSRLFTPSPLHILQAQYLLQNTSITS